MKPATPEIQREIRRRRTFAIISHPDAGKTTVTEKLLLFGNAIQMAGTVKAKKSKAFATSDWMEIEKQRGISVSSSVMQFRYGDREINLLDTPGHADFSEDTYRVLTAVDAALMVIDSAKGIEAQTRKLFQVCRDRHIPIMTFMNKLDREGRDPFDLVNEVESELNLACAVMTWPIGQGGRFHGVYDRANKSVRVFEAGKKTADFSQEVFTDLDDAVLQSRIPEEFIAKLREDLELIDGAGHPFDEKEFLAGRQSPVFFGSAVNNFGVQELLDAFVRFAPSPLPREAAERMVSPEESQFTGLIFKIQANMDPKHRDRCCFMRICSGEFVQGMSVYSPRLKREFKINNALQFMSQERKNVDRAYAGDIVGINDRDTLRIGDALTQGEELKFTGVPQFSPDLFALVDLKNPIKMKQLQRGVEHLAEEGSSQVFRRKHNSDLVLGVVGRLQFEVVKFRLLHEYGADAIFTSMPYTASRWYRCADKAALTKFEEFYTSQIVWDARDYPVLLIKNDWEQRYIEEKHPAMRFYSSLLTYERDA